MQHNGHAVYVCHSPSPRLPWRVEGGHQGGFDSEFGSSTTHSGVQNINPKADFGYPVSRIRLKSFLGVLAKWLIHYFGRNSDQLAQPAFKLPSLKHYLELACKSPVQGTWCLQLRALPSLSRFSWQCHCKCFVRKKHVPQDDALATFRMQSNGKCNGPNQPAMQSASDALRQRTSLRSLPDVDSGMDAIYQQRNLPAMHCAKEPPSRPSLMWEVDWTQSTSDAIYQRRNLPAMQCAKEPPSRPSLMWAWDMSRNYVPEKCTPPPTQAQRPPQRCCEMSCKHS